MPNRLTYLNGFWVPESEAKISVYDEWCLSGVGVFEMSRSFLTVPFKLEEHIARLYRGLDEFQIPHPMRQDEMVQLCLECQAKNQGAMERDDEHRLMVTVSPGIRDMYQYTSPRFFQSNSPLSTTVSITDFPLRWTVKGFGKYYTEGVHCSMSQVRQNTSINPRIKHRNRAHFWLAQQQAPEWTWPILLEPEYGRIAECPGANIVMAKGGMWYSAWLGCLHGISLDFVSHLLENQNISLNRHSVNQRELRDADEIFLTGTPFCILPVTMLDGKPVGTGKPGPVYQSLLKAWSADVGVDIQAQIERWDA